MYQAYAITEHGKYTFFPQPSYRLAQLDIRELRAELTEGGHKSILFLGVAKIVIKAPDNRPTSIFHYSGDYKF
jgi:hypothetical protein